MKIAFIHNIPKNYPKSSILISGQSSRNLKREQLLSVSNESEIIGVYEIRYEYHCSPFKQADILDDVIAVGFEEHFYLFDFVKEVKLLVLKLSGYFGYTHYNNDLIYVADASGLYCIEKRGNIIWSNDGLGIDGVTIDKFNESEIHGSGEWDPPNGWRDFVLDKQTGKNNY